MEQLPLYIYAAVFFTAAATLFFFYKAANGSKKILVIALAWLTLQAFIGLSGFYAKTDAVPPRFLLTLMPPLLLIAALFATKKGRKFLNGLNTRWLTLLHVVRLPVEMLLLWLFLHRYVPQLMTFEGRNFDVFSGLTAPAIFYFGYMKKTLGRNVLLLWNFACLALLINIVVIAIFAAPFPFQKFAFDQPNVAVLYFPFVWLPAFIVPSVLFAHLASIRQLMLQKKEALRRPSLQKNFA